MAIEDDADFTIEFRRQLDGLAYLFRPAALRDQRPCWRRTDLDLHLQWSAGHGWNVSDAAGTVLSRPWDVERDDQGSLPPEGVWVSRKEAKAYVYELVYQRAPSS